MALSRNKEHELIAVCIYDALTHISLEDEFSVEDVMEGIFQCSFSEISIFAKTIVVKALKNLDQTIAIFQVNMPKWKFDRLNKFEQAILLMSYTHRQVDESVNKKVIIDVAVRLSKKYLDDEDYKFVNAILDKVL